MFNDASGLFKGAFSFNDTFITEAQMNDTGFESFNTTFNPGLYAANFTLMSLLDQTESLIKGAEDSVENVLVGLGLLEKNQTKYK